MKAVQAIMSASEMCLYYTGKCKNRAIEVVRIICSHAKYLPIKCAQKR